MLNIGQMYSCHSQRKMKAQSSQYLSRDRSNYDDQISSYTFKYLFHLSVLLNIKLEKIVENKWLTFFTFIFCWTLF